MKHQVEEELLKTLNGQLNELPSAAKTMVQQYQLSAIVTSIFCAVALIVIVVGIVLTVKWCRKNNFDDGSFVLAMGACLGVIMSVILWINVVHACAPIYSIVQAFLGH